MASEQTNEQHLICIRGVTNRENLWYCIDLVKSLSHKIFLVARMDSDSETGGEWTVVGDYIYWAGGILNLHFSPPPRPYMFSPRPPRPYTSLELKRYKIKSSNPSVWETVSFSKKLHRHEARVFADGDTIYVLGGNRFSYEGFEDEGRYCGEAYNINTKKWELVALNVQDFSFFTCGTTALVKEKGETKVVCYAADLGYLLFYNVRTDDFEFEVHPHLCLGGPSFPYLEAGLDKDDLSILLDVVNNARAVVSNSTLYWFTYSCNLFGYDFSKKRWFKSASLKGNLWKELTQDFQGYYDEPYREFPVLVHPCNENFVVIAPLANQNLGVASLVVSKCPDSLDVSVELCSTFSVDPYFTPIDGIAIVKG